MVLTSAWIAPLSQNQILVGLGLCKESTPVQGEFLQILLRQVILKVVDLPGTAQV